MEINRHCGGDVAQLVERRTGTPLTQVRIPGAARDFSPTVKLFSADSFTRVRTPPCAIACIYICAQVKNPVVLEFGGLRKYYSTQHVP